MYNSLIIPVITYGSERWTLNVDIAKRLASFERKILIRFLRITSRLKWISHMNIINADRISKSIFCNQAEENKLTGRPMNQ